MIIEIELLVLSFYMVKGYIARCKTCERLISEIDTERRISNKLDNEHFEKELHHNEFKTVLIEENIKLKTNIDELKAELTKHNQTPYIEGIGYDYAQGIIQHPFSVINPPMHTNKIRVEMRQGMPVKVYCRNPQGLSLHHGIFPKDNVNMLLTHTVSQNIHLTGLENININRVISEPDDIAKQELMKINREINRL